MAPGVGGETGPFRVAAPGGVFFRGRGRVERPFGSTLPALVSKMSEEASPPKLVSGVGGETGRFRVAAPGGSRRLVRGGVERPFGSILPIFTTKTTEEASPHHMSVEVRRRGQSARFCRHFYIQRSRRPRCPIWRLALVKRRVGSKSPPRGISPPRLGGAAGWRGPSASSCHFYNEKGRGGLAAPCVG